MRPFLFKYRRERSCHEFPNWSSNFGLCNVDCQRSTRSQILLCFFTFLSVSFGVEISTFLSSVVGFHRWQRDFFVVPRPTDGKTDIRDYEEVLGVSLKVANLRMYGSEYSTSSGLWWISWQNENLFCLSCFLAFLISPSLQKEL
jgi:hypothetical protein